MLKNKHLFLLFSLIAILGVALAGCAPATQAPVETEAPPEETEEMEETEAPTEEPTPVATEEMEPELGSEERPIQVLFVPSVEAGVITTGGEIMAEALNEATGLTFEVSVPTSYAATIEAMCASPGDTMGFIPALGYVLANNRCGVEVGAAAVRRGLSWYTTMYLVAADSEAQTLADLEGMTWAFPDPGSTSGYLYPKADFTAAGVTVGDELAAGGHPEAVLALYNGQAEVATAFFSPPGKPGDEAWNGNVWEEMFGWAVEGGPFPEPWLQEGLDPAECFVDAEGALLCGEYQVLDARLTVVETAPDIMAKTKIMALSPKIPNDTLSFGPEFPAELRTQIIDALVAFSETDGWDQSIGHEDFYGWSSLEPVEDSVYDAVRNLIEQLGYTEEDILG